MNDWKTILEDGGIGAIIGGLIVWLFQKFFGSRSDQQIAKR